MRDCRHAGDRRRLHGDKALWQNRAMRDAFLALLVLVCACGTTDDTSSASGSDSMTGSGSSDSGSESSTANPTSSAGAECSGDFFGCFADDEASCIADKCCVAVFGRRYEQNGDAWCLRAEEEYVSCAIKFNNTCDNTGTFACTNSKDEMYLAELDTACYPRSCGTTTTPDTGGAVCGG